jgi:hypothetical protein
MPRRAAFPTMPLAACVCVTRTPRAAAVSRSYPVARRRDTAHAAWPVWVVPEVGRVSSLAVGPDWYEWARNRIFGGFEFEAGRALSCSSWVTVLTNPYERYPVIPRRIMVLLPRHELVRVFTNHNDRCSMEITMRRPRELDLKLIDAAPAVGETKQTMKHPVQQREAWVALVLWITISRSV